MTGPLLPVQGDPFASSGSAPDLGLPGRDPGVLNANDHSQRANRAQAEFLRQYQAAGGWDSEQPLGSLRHPFGMFPGSPAPERSAMKSGDWFVDFDGQMKQLGEGPDGSRHVLAPVQGDPFAAEGHMSAGEDAARSSAVGLAKMGAGAVGTPGDLLNGLVYGLDAVGKPIAHALGVPDGQPWVGLGKNGEYVVHKPYDPEYLPSRQLGLPTSTEANTAVQGVTGPYHTPQTGWGRTAETAAEYLPGGALPGSLAARLGRWAIPALASSAAGEITRGTPVEPWARLGGGLLGVGGEGALEGVVNRPIKVLGQSAEGLSSDDIARAAALRDSARSMGINLTIPEAVQHVTNGATGLGRLQRLLESSRPTSATWSAFMADRPNQVAGAVNDFTSGLEPGPLMQPGVLGGMASRTGTGLIDQAIGTVRKAADKAGYTAADAQSVDGSMLSAILDRIGGQIAGDQTGLVAPRLTQLRDNLTLTPEVPPTPPAAPPAAAAPPAGAGNLPPLQADPSGLAAALADVRTYGPGRSGDMFSAIQARGGVRTKDSTGFRYMAGPDLDQLGVQRPGLINNRSGMTPEQMAQALHDDGWFGHGVSDPSDAFASAWSDQVAGRPVYHPEAYGPDYEARARALDEEMTNAGISLAGGPQAAARKLADYRAGDDLERQAVQWEGNLNDPDLAEFDRFTAPRTSPVDMGSPGSPAVPVTNIGQLSTARNHWLDVLDNAPPDRLSNHVGGMIRSHLDDLETVLRGNPDYLAGVNAYADGSRTLVDPLQQGPVGAISRTGDLGAQTAQLYPQTPFPGQPAATADAVSLLGSQSPGLPDQMTRQHLERLFGQSTRNLTTGPNQYGGALFARNVAGNPLQSETLHAGLDALDPSGGQSGQFSDLVNALMATGRRERPGSMTAFNQEDREALSMAPAPVKFLGTLLDPLEWGPALSHYAGRLGYNHNLGQLSDLLLDPDTARALQTATTAAPWTPGMAQAVIPFASSLQGGPP